MESARRKSLGEEPGPASYLSAPFCTHHRAKTRPSRYPQTGLCSRRCSRLQKKFLLTAEPGPEPRSAAGQTPGGSGCPGLHRQLRGGCHRWILSLTAGQRRPCATAGGRGLRQVFFFFVVLIFIFSSSFLSSLPIPQVFFWFWTIEIRPAISERRGKGGSVREAIHGSYPSELPGAPERLLPTSSRGWRLPAPYPYRPARCWVRPPAPSPRSVTGSRRKGEPFPARIAVRTDRFYL